MIAFWPEISRILSEYLSVTSEEDINAIVGDPVKWTSKITWRCAHKDDLSDDEKTALQGAGCKLNEKGFLTKVVPLYIRSLDVRNLSITSLIGWCNAAYGYRGNFDVPNMQKVNGLLGDGQKCFCGNDLLGCVLFNFDETFTLRIVIGGYTTGCGFFEGRFPLTHPTMFKRISCSKEVAFANAALQCIRDRQAIDSVPQNYRPLILTLVLVESSRAPISLAFTVMGLVVVVRGTKKLSWFKENHPMTRGSASANLGPALLSTAVQLQGMQENPILQGMIAIVREFIAACNVDDEETPVGLLGEFLPSADLEEIQEQLEQVGIKK